jgi:hypothetical protein
LGNAVDQLKCLSSCLGAANDTLKCDFRQLSHSEGSLLREVPSANIGNAPESEALAESRSRLACLARLLPIQCVNVCFEKGTKMIKTTIATLGSLLMGTMLLIAGPSGLRSQTYTGVITDSMCGADHTKMHVTPESKCVQECVRYGAKYALLVGKNVYTLSDQKTPSKFAAQKVQVTGTLDAKSKVLNVTGIRPVK